MTDRAAAEHHVREMLKCLGQDVTREGLGDTPRRVVAMYTDLLTPAPFTFTTFDNDSKMDEMIVQRHIQFYSMCEHHLLPFFGTATVAYIPTERIVGLSKLARTVRHCAAGFQNQERITSGVAALLQEKLAPRGVAVVLRARHLCMEMRGVEAPGSETVTSDLRGSFLDDPRARAEFLALAGAG